MSTTTDTPKSAPTEGAKKPAAKRAASKETPPAPGAGAAGVDPAPDSGNVEKQRKAQLKAGETTGKVKAAANERSKMSPAEQRAGVKGAVPVEGRVDNMTRRSDADVLQGHFCLIDFGDKDHGKDAIAAVEAVVGEGNARVGSGDYGVYIGPGELDDQGYPLTATVLLRDEHSALVGSVPYGALRPTQAGGRR